MTPENIYIREGEWATSPEIQRPRVVVTGIGLITPQGIDTESTWQNIVNGRTGIRQLDFDRIARNSDLEELANFPTDINVIGEIDPELKLDEYIASLNISYHKPNEKGIYEKVRKSDTRRMSRAVQLSLLATAQALENAQLLKDGKIVPEIDKSRFGSVVGTSIGGVDRLPLVYKHLLDIQNPHGRKKRLSPFEPLNVGLERTSSVPSLIFGAESGKFTPTDACATGSQALISAYQDILSGDSDIVIAGGVDASIDPIAIEMFGQMPALSKEKDPNRASRPFDKDRDGFVMAEGAGILILESEEHALKRGAKIIAEFSGYGKFSDAHHDTEPSGEAAERSLRRAIQRSGLPDNGIIYVNAHGTSTIKGDPAEVSAIRRVMDELPGRFEYAVSSTKSSMGHTMGASGAIEAGIAILALRDNILPPTLHLENVMEEGEEMNLVPNDAQQAKIDTVYSGNFGFGGSGTNVAFKRYYPR